MGPESAPEPYQNVGIFTRLLEGLENGSSNPYVFVVFWDAFWPTFRFLGQKSASGSKTLNPVRTPGCGFRCFSWKIASRNHQYSLGFNWYFACGDDGKLDSKSTWNLLVLCRVFTTFPPSSGKVIAKASRNHWYVYVFCYFFAKTSGIGMQNTSKVIRGVAKTRIIVFWKSSKNPT